MICIIVTQRSLISFVFVESHCFKQKTTYRIFCFEKEATSSSITNKRLILIEVHDIHSCQVLGVLKLLNVPIFSHGQVQISCLCWPYVNHTIRYAFFKRIHDLSFCSKRHSDLRDIPKNGLTLKLSINQLYN